MKRVISSYLNLPLKVRLAFDEASDASDLEQIRYPQGGSVQKGLMFEYENTCYIVRLDQEQRYFGTTMEELDQSGEGLDIERVFDEEE